MSRPLPLPVRCWNLNTFTMSNFLDDFIDPVLATRHVAQNTDEWDTVRAGRFTSSEMYRLMGPAYRPMTKEELAARPKKGVGSAVTRAVDNTKLSTEAEGYIKQKVAEVLTGMPKQSAYAYPIVYGKEMEPQAIEYFVEETGLRYESVGFICFGEHAGGSPDGMVEDDAILEVKCPYAIDTQIDYLMLTDQWDLKRMYPEYYWQVMSNMLFADRTKAHFVTYDPRYLDKKHVMQRIVVEAKEEDFQAITDKIGAAVEEKLKLLKLLA